MTTGDSAKGHGGPKCGGKLSKGKPGTCTQAAGWGTDHPGLGRCKLHGGATPNHGRAAVAEQARRDVELFNECVNPIWPHCDALIWPHPRVWGRAGRRR